MLTSTRHVWDLLPEAHLIAKRCLVNCLASVLITSSRNHQQWFPVSCGCYTCLHRAVFSLLGKTLNIAQKCKREGWPEGRRNGMELWLWCGPKDVVIYEISLNDTSFRGRIPSTLICPILSPLTGLSKSCVMSSLVLWHPSRIKSLKSQKDDSQGCQCNAIGHPSLGIVSKGWWQSEGWWGLSILWTSTVVFFLRFQGGFYPVKMTVKRDRLQILSNT